jgi:hypothetical protein
MLYSAAVVQRLLPPSHTHTRSKRAAAHLAVALLQARAMRIRASHTCRGKPRQTPPLRWQRVIFGEMQGARGVGGRGLLLTVSCASRRAPICCRPILEKQLLRDCRRV